MALGDFKTLESGIGAVPSPSFAAVPSGYVLSKSLAASTAEAFAVPAGARIVVLSANCDFHARFNALTGGTAATVPGDVTDGTACPLNPAVRAVDGVQEISVISSTGGIVTAEFWS